MKKFSLLEGKDLSYNDFFGKNISHIESLGSRIKSDIIEIIMDENSISEKSFNEYNKIIKLVEEKFNEDILSKAVELYNSGKRIKYIAEILYDEYFK